MTSDSIDVWLHENYEWLFSWWLSKPVMMSKLEQFQEFSSPPYSDLTFTFKHMRLSLVRHALFGVRSTIAVPIDEGFSVVTGKVECFGGFVAEVLKAQGTEPNLSLFLNQKELLKYRPKLVAEDWMEVVPHNRGYSVECKCWLTW